MGFCISIDDFGTGFSSMSYLKSLPIDYIKIDRSFIEDVCFNKDDESITRAIISLAHSLNLKVTAEGIENYQQSKLLSHMHCDEGQGHLYSHPLPINDFQDWYLNWLEQLAS